MENTMKKSTKTVGTIAAIGIMLVCAYLIGTTQAETVIETQKVIETVEVIPDGYIALNECIPLSDVACYFIDGYDYPCFGLKDVVNQLDDDRNRSYADIMNDLPDETEDFKNNFVDMRQVTDFITDNNGLYLYLEDGTGYYWER